MHVFNLQRIRQAAYGPPSRAVGLWLQNGMFSIEWIDSQARDAWLRPDGRQRCLAQHIDGIEWKLGTQAAALGSPPGKALLRELHPCALIPGLGD
jgi:hypothetical protein